MKNKTNIFENKIKFVIIITSHDASGTFDIPFLEDGDTYVNGVKILGSVDASNGVVHVIDKVFLVANE